MKTIQGPAIFLAQFMGDTAPFDSLESVCTWAAELGYKGVQIPSWDARLIDLEKAADSQTYCDELRGRVEACGVQITELSTRPTTNNSTPLRLKPFTGNPMRAPPGLCKP